MTERASIFQTVQIGVETVPGTAVAANRKLQSVDFSTAIKADISKFRPMGSKFATLTALGKEYTEHSLSGQLTYTEIIYLLASVVGLDTGVPVDNLDGSYSWVFSPNVNSADNYVTFTVEQGSAVRAQKSTYCLVKDLTLNFDRSETKIEAGALAQSIQDNITMTSSPTTIDLVPVLPKHLCVYLADSHDELSTASALQRVMSCSYALSDRYSTVWPINRALDSFGAVVESEPKLQIKLKMEADAEGMDLLTTMRAGDTKFIRIEAIGGEIDTGVDYELIIDTAIQVEEPSEFRDEDGLYAIEWGFTCIADSTWGKATEITVTNDIAAL